MRFTLGRGKRPAENFEIEIDFALDIATGDTAASHVVSAVDAADPATDLTATITENAALDGAISGVRIKAGTAGHTYIVKHRVTTTLGDIFEHDYLVTVSDSA